MKKRKFWANLSVNHPLRNYKGFTLVELMITMGLIGIMLMGAVTVFMTGSDAFVSAQVRNRQQLLLDGMVEAISGELRYATKVELQDTATGGIYASGEDLFISSVSTTEPALSTDGYDLALEFQRMDDYTLLLHILLTDESSDITTKESVAIRLINCEILKHPMEERSVGVSVSYTTESRLNQ